MNSTTDPLAVAAEWLELHPVGWAMGSGFELLERLDDVPTINGQASRWQMSRDDGTELIGPVALAADFLVNAMGWEPVTIRRAYVPAGATVEQVANYLPACYYAQPRAEGGVLIVGWDEAGWTLEDYVIPRLASGMYFARLDEAPAGR